jgi:hypothetical protein
MVDNEYSYGVVLLQGDATNTVEAPSSLRCLHSSASFSGFSPSKKDTIWFPSAIKCWGATVMSVVRFLLTTINTFDQSHTKHKQGVERNEVPVDRSS